ncbi:uncharacterized protein LOC121377717 [Gigantopelta aegis]|uniref:uncharacterized protein LOC121377717 n=1 Tax=Gigantopelta aegis TaxID=1735272 RepID=UPI001B8886C2|nr:uncharacterized protein LOC121377717 [Gigantopelta aegis]
MRSAKQVNVKLVKVCSQCYNMSNTTWTCAEPGIPCGHAFFRSKPWQHGERQIVYKGILFPGDGHQERSVGVRVGRCAGWNKTYCQRVVIQCQKVRELAKKFNERQIAMTTIRSLVPRMAIMDDVANNRGRRLSENEWVLIDEQRLNYLSDCQNKITDTFMHFTYHASGGQLVVCAFKGANSEKQLTLTDTVVHSLGKHYGDLDNGPDGMKAVFKNHTCNEMCNGWSKPPVEEEGIILEVKVILDRSPSLSPSAPPLEQDSKSWNEDDHTITTKNYNGGHFEGQVRDACQQISALLADQNSRNSIISAKSRQSPVYSEHQPPVYFERSPPPYCELPPSYWESETCNQCYHGDIRPGTTRTQSLLNLVDPTGH